MVLPQDQEGQARVRAVRNREGRFIGFQDPDQGGRFITRQEALSRLSFSVERGEVLDSFGNGVGVGAVKLPGRGVDVTYQTRAAEYKPMTVDPARFTPNPNQEIVERNVFMTKDGKLVTSETSWGLGKKYDPAKYGGRWRQSASDALGLDKAKRLPTRDLERAVLMREFIVKTIR
jgi:hypothetical protein